MKLSEFDYCLPKEYIAQEPLIPRDECRLLILSRKDMRLRECVFKHIIHFLQEGDLLVLNDTRVLPARLVARRSTGGRLEILLLRQIEPALWEALISPGRKARVGEDILFAEGRLHAEILERTPEGGRLIKFSQPNIQRLIHKYGKMPLPHYIKKELKIPDYYQTVYAKQEGAIASPTAGLHFTRTLLRRLASIGVEIIYITLHCGLATFRPVKSIDIREHRMPTEYFQINPRAARKINKARVAGRRIVAVGTTVARAIETASYEEADNIYLVRAQEGYTNLYICPGYRFRIVNALLTNFHLPRSTNLILVSAFAGIDFIRSAYKYAIEKRFRFYSFGDAMLIQ